MRKLTVPAGGARTPPGAWTDLWRRAFKLEPHESAKLWGARPFTVALGGDDAQIADRLRKMGLAADVRDDPSSPPPCAAHPKAGADEVCPKCGERRACAICLAVSALCPRCAGTRRARTRFRNVRVTILLLILVFVGSYTWLSVRRVRSWKSPLSVAIYPVNASSDPAVTAWTAKLARTDFEPIAAFLQAEARKNGVTTSPLVTLRVGKPVSGVAPPPPPVGGAPLKIALWSLKLRWWNLTTRWKHGLPGAAVKIWVLYQPPGDGEPIPHSLGLEKLHIGVVHTRAGAHDAGWTNVAIAHELLHTAAASDKYGDGGKPVFPDGYADPSKPVQTACELMAGSIPIGPDTWRPARSLDECVVGARTAREIGWLPSASPRAP